jgi:hypothetical protein
LISDYEARRRSIIRYIFESELAVGNRNEKVGVINLVWCLSGDMRMFRQILNRISYQKTRI